MQIKNLKPTLSLMFLSLQHAFAVGYGAVLDSGTTFTYLPTGPFRKFSKALRDYARSKGLEAIEGPDPQVVGDRLSVCMECIPYCIDPQ